MAKCMCWRATAMRATTVEAGLNGGAGDVRYSCCMHMRSDLWTLTLKTSSLVT